MKRIQGPKTKTGIEADCESETETQLGLNGPRREFRRSRKINNRRKRQQGRRIKSFGHEEESANNVSSWPSCDGGCRSISTTIKRGSQIQIQIHTWLAGNTYPPLPLLGNPRWLLAKRKISQAIFKFSAKTLRSASGSNRTAVGVGFRLAVGLVVGGQRLWEAEMRARHVTNCGSGIS